jgi:hypothetical protein
MRRSCRSSPTSRPVRRDDLADSRPTCPPLNRSAARHLRAGAAEAHLFRDHGGCLPARDRGRQPGMAPVVQARPGAASWTRACCRRRVKATCGRSATSVGYRCPGSFRPRSPIPTIPRRLPTRGSASAPGARARAPGCARAAPHQHPARVPPCGRPRSAPTDRRLRAAWSPATATIPTSSTPTVRGRVFVHPNAHDHAALQAGVHWEFPPPTVPFLAR